MRVAVLFSGGKDSVFCTYWSIYQSWEVCCLLTMKSINPDSFMFHTPNIDRAEMQAEAMQIPILIKTTKGIKEDEIDDLEELISQAHSKYNLNGIVVGALASEYQRIRVNKACRKLNLKVLAPIWHRDPLNYMNDLIQSKFDIRLIAVAAYPLEKKHLLRKIDEKFLDELLEMNKQYGLHICGEGGEYETIVLDCLIYKKKLEINDYEVVEDTDNSAKINIKKIELKEK